MVACRLGCGPKTNPLRPHPHAHSHSHRHHQHVASIEHVQPLQVNKFLKVNYYNIFIKAQFLVSRIISIDIGVYTPYPYEGGLFWQGAATVQFFTQLSTLAHSQAYGKFINLFNFPDK